MEEVLDIKPPRYTTKPVLVGGHNGKNYFGMGEFNSERNELYISKPFAIEVEIHDFSMLELALTTAWNPLDMRVTQESTARIWSTDGSHAVKWREATFDEINLILTRWWVTTRLNTEKVVNEYNRATSSPPPSPVVATDPRPARCEKCGRKEKQ